MVVQKFPNGTERYVLGCSPDSHPNSAFRTSASPAGPFVDVWPKMADGKDFSSYNPAPVWVNQTWYMTSQNTEAIWTAPELEGPWSVFAHIDRSQFTGIFKAAIEDRALTLRFAAAACSRTTSQ